MVLFIGVFLALNQPIPSAGKPFQEPQKRSANTGQQSHNQEKPTQPSVPPVAPILQPDAAPQAQEKPAEVPNSKNPETSNERVAWFTGILAVVAVLQLVTLIWQILTARSTARKELQAYVLPVGASRYKCMQHLGDLRNDDSKSGEHDNYYDDHLDFLFSHFYPLFQNSRMEA